MPAQISRQAMTLMVEVLEKMRHITIIGREIYRPQLKKDDGTEYTDPDLLRALTFQSPNERPEGVAARSWWDADDWECCSDLYRLADLTCEAVFCAWKASQMRVRDLLTTTETLPQETFQQKKIRLAKVFTEKGMAREALHLKADALMLQAHIERELRDASRADQEEIRRSPMTISPLLGDPVKAVKRQELRPPLPDPNSLPDPVDDRWTEGS